MWQRLAPMALVFLISRAVLRFVRENLFVFVGAGAGVAFVERLGIRELLLFAALVLVAVMVAAVIHHRRFRFRVEDDAVRIRRGVFEHKELRVRFDRVQNVQLGQPVYFRPFDLVAFSIETPGAAEREVELPGIPRGLAEEMRDRILGARREDAGELDAEGPASLVRPSGLSGPVVSGVEMAPASLLHVPGIARVFLHGLSSNQVWLIAGVLIYLLDLGIRQGTDSTVVEQLLGWLERQAATGWSVLLLLALGVFSVLLVAAGLAALLRYHPYRLRDHGSRLVGSGGLLERREQTLRRDKLTGAVLKQSPVGRVLGCWTLTGLQTRSDGRADAAGQRSFLVPGLGAGDLELVGKFYPGARVPEGFESIHRQYRVWLLSRGFALMLAILALLVASLGRGHGVVLLVTLSMVALPPLVWLRWRYWGWFIDGPMFWLRRGLLGQRLDTFELARVQQVQVRSSHYQRRHGLVTLVLVLPHGLVQVPFLPEALAAQLANRALFAAETAREHRL